MKKGMENEKPFCHSEESRDKRGRDDEESPKVWFNILGSEILHFVQDDIIKRRLIYE
jgi:hypothetical protein